MHPHPHSPPHQQHSSSRHQKALLSTLTNSGVPTQSPPLQQQSEPREEASGALALIEGNSHSPTKNINNNNNNNAETSPKVHSPSHSTRIGAQSARNATLLSSPVKIPQNLPTLSCWPARPTYQKANAASSLASTSTVVNHNNDLLLLRQATASDDSACASNANYIFTEETGPGRTAGVLTLTSSKPALATQLEKELSVKLSSKKSLTERVDIVSDLLRKFSKMFPSYGSVMHAAIDVIHGFSNELTNEVVRTKDVAISSVRDFQRCELRDLHVVLEKESAKRIALEAEVATLKDVLSKKVHEREHDVQLAHAETMKLIRRTYEEAHMEDEVKRLRLHVGQLATECAKLKVELHKYESERTLLRAKHQHQQRRGKDASRTQSTTTGAGQESGSTENGDDIAQDADDDSPAGAASAHLLVRDVRETLPPSFIEASKHELEKCRMVMQREIVDCAAGTNSAFRLKIGHLQHEVEELQAKLKESQHQKELVERLAYERRYVRGTLPVDIFEAIKRDGLAKPDEALPRLREEGALGPQEAMRRDELSSIASCYTPRPFIPFDVQSVLGISLSERSRDVVEQLAVAAVDLHEEIVAMRKNNRKLFAAARWMSAQEMDRIFEEEKEHVEREERDKKTSLGIRASSTTASPPSQPKSQSSSAAFSASASSSASSPATPPDTSSFSIVDGDDEVGKKKRDEAQKRKTPLTSISLFNKMTSSSFPVSPPSSAAAHSSFLQQAVGTTSSTTTAATRIDGIIPTYRESEWPYIPHFLRTDVSLGILCKNWSARETISFSVQVLELLSAATERARRMKDKFMIKPPVDVLTERRRSPLVPPLDATTASMLPTHAVGHPSSDGARKVRRGFVPIGYAVTVALRMLAEKQLLYESEAQSDLMAKRMQQAAKTDGATDYDFSHPYREDDQQSQQERHGPIAASSSLLLGLNMKASSSLPAANRRPSAYYSTSRSSPSAADSYHLANRSAIMRLATNYAYNWWDSLHRYQDKEPLCRLTLKILDGTTSRGVFEFFKKFIYEIHDDLTVAAASASTSASAAASSSPASPSIVDQDDHQQQQQQHSLVWPVFVKRLAWRFSGSPIENLSRKGIFAAAKTVDFLHLSFADRLPVSKMLSLELFSSSPSSMTKPSRGKNDDASNEQHEEQVEEEGEADDLSSSQKRMSPLANALLSITMEAMQELFNQVYEKLEPAVKQSTFAEGVSILNAGDAMQLAKEMDSSFLRSKRSDLVNKICDNMARHHQHQQQQQPRIQSLGKLTSQTSSAITKNKKQKNSWGVANAGEGVGGGGGVTFADENLDEGHLYEQLVDGSGVDNDVNDEDIQEKRANEFLLRQASSSAATSCLSFCARVYVKTALQLCFKLDGNVHKPRKATRCGGGSADSGTFNNDNSSGNGTATGRDNRAAHSNLKKKRKRRDGNASVLSTSRTERSSNNASKNSDDQEQNRTGSLADTLPFARGSRKNSPPHIVHNNNDNNNSKNNNYFLPSPSTVLEDILNHNNRTGSSSNKSRGVTTKPTRKRRASLTKKEANHEHSNDDIMSELLFADETGDDTKNTKTNRNCGATRGDGDDPTQEQSFNDVQGVANEMVLGDDDGDDSDPQQGEIDEKDWVEWHEFISKLRRVTPKGFSAEEIMNHFDIAAKK